jgi:hypothetical protein
MATKSETTYTHTCDLCGQVKDDYQLRHLYDKPSTMPSTMPKKVDICQDCSATKEIDHVFAYFDEKPLHSS